jgi:hypothetical protein
MPDPAALASLFHPLPSGRCQVGLKPIKPSARSGRADTGRRWCALRGTCGAIAYVRRARGSVHFVHASDAFGVLSGSAGAIRRQRRVPAQWDKGELPHHAPLGGAEANRPSPGRQLASGLRGDSANAGFLTILSGCSHASSHSDGTSLVCRFRAGKPVENTCGAQRASTSPALCLTAGCTRAATVLSPS